MQVRRLAILGGMLALNACASLPPGRQAVDKVNVTGNANADDDEILEKLATAPSAKFLGLWRGVVYDYEIYSPGTLERDLARVQRFYQAHGFYDAKVRAGRVRPKNDKHVEVTIEVEEGEPVKIEQILIEGLENVEPAAAAAARRALAIKVGQRFEEDSYELSRQQILQALTDRGYAHARVRRQAQLDLPDHRARVRYRVRPGPITRYGDITIEGLGHLPEKPVREALGLKPGERYSTEEIKLARSAILGLGGFAAVDIDIIDPNAPAPGAPANGNGAASGSAPANGNGAAPANGNGASGNGSTNGTNPDATDNGITTTPGGGNNATPATQPGAGVNDSGAASGGNGAAASGAANGANGATNGANGAAAGGAEPRPEDASPVVPLRVKVQPTALRGLRLGGGVEIDVIRSDIHALVGWEHRNFLGGFRHLTITARPGLVFYPTRLPTLQKPTAYLPEARLQGELAQPGFLEARTRGTLRGQFEVAPVLLSSRYDPTATVIGYRESRGSVGLERTFWERWFGSVSINGQRNAPFAYVGPLDPTLGPVNIAYLQMLVQYDRRNDKIHPHSGWFVGNDLQVAPGVLDARDVRVQPEARGYIPIGRKVTLAMRASVGFLFPGNYGQTLQSNTDFGRPPDGVSRADWVRDVQIVYLRAFFSGGPNSNRGYALRDVGPHGVVPFFQPTLAAQAIQQGCDTTVENDPRCAQPLGGLTLWEASMELRFPIVGALAGATFCDSSDVSAKKVNLRFNRLHLSCGLGIRIDTPVGPIRADAGVRVPGAQVLGQSDDAVDGGLPSTIFGLPMAVSLGIGEAF